ncbi:MAG: hypothetical protein K6G22_09065 [Lachnospiraceae bacterium]|nr:hypothetical protein [Lachnospiraceae bacterium]
MADDFAVNSDVFDDGNGSSPYTPDIGNQTVKSTLKYIPVIFIVDCSITMEEDGRIGAVNGALNELKYRLQQIQSDNGLDLKIAIMSFTSSAKWEVELTPIDEYVFKDMSTRPGLTQYGVAFHELNRVLTKDLFMKHTGKCAPPAIMFLTDGKPNDDYEYDLNVLLKNGWFAGASRSAVLMGDAINDPAAKAALSRFVKNPDEEIVSSENSTSIIQKIELLTKHTVAGEPINDDDEPAGQVAPPTGQTDAPIGQTDNSSDTGNDSGTDDQDDDSKGGYSDSDNTSDNDVFKDNSIITNPFDDNEII